MPTQSQTDTIRELQRQVDHLTMKLEEATASPQQQPPRLDRRELIANGHSCHLSRLEAKLVGQLLKHPSAVIYHGQVCQRWSDGPASLRRLVCRLKNRLAGCGMFSMVGAIESENGGYLFVQKKLDI